MGKNLNKIFFALSLSRKILTLLNWNLMPKGPSGENILNKTEKLLLIADAHYLFYYLTLEPSVICRVRDRSEHSNHLQGWSGTHTALKYECMWHRVSHKYCIPLLSFILTHWSTLHL